jgi:hypothetical protein
MKRLIEFRLSGGGSMVVEVDDVTSPGQERAARLAHAATKAQETFEAAVSKIKPAAVWQSLVAV